METKELIKRLSDIEFGEGEFPLPDTMIDEIIERLKEGKPKVDKRFIEEWYPAINYLAHSDEAKEEHKGILRRMLEKAGVEVLE